LSLYLAGATIAISRDYGVDGTLSRIVRLGADDVELLRRVGIRTGERLLDEVKSPKGRRLLAEKIGIDAQRLLDFANAADYMRIKGMGKGYVTLLRAVDVMTVRELRNRNSESLAKAMAEVNKKMQVGALPAF
jgi:Domain of unknown function (DUF4332)